MRNWFSNFIPFDNPMLYGDIIFRTPEHFFQAMKTEDLSLRKKIAAFPTPGAVKRFARTIQLRPDWEDIKFTVMKYALRRKFALRTTWRERLLDSGNSEIVEWNTWHDNIWGDCTCPRCEHIVGQNNLGRILMKLRHEFKEVSP